MSDIRVVEDETVLAKSIVTFLERRGFPARFAVDAASAKAMFQRQAPRLVILDYKLNEDDGLDLLRWIRHTDQRVQVVMMTGHGDVTIAVQAMKAGARDFLTKPAPLASIAAIASELMLEDMSPALDPVGVERIVGRSSAANSLRKQVTKLANAVPVGAVRPGVLIAGPPGCGKGLVAMALHEATDAHAPLSVLDCSRLDEGATEPLAEAMNEAQGGTLLLRRVGTLDSVGQDCLMRLLDRADPPPSLVATTDHPLSGDTFPSDLLFRIQVGWIDVPALSERTADILPIAEVIARRLARATGQARPLFSATARAKLLEHDWPGNVSELVNCIERAMLMREQDTIEGDHIRPTSHVSMGDDGPLPTLSEMEQEAIRKALHRTGGNVSRAAEMLGVSRDTLRYRMEKFDLQRE